MFQIRENSDRVAEFHGPIMVHELVPAVTYYAFGSHPRQVFSISYPLPGFFHAGGRGFESRRSGHCKINVSGDDVATDNNHRIDIKTNVSSSVRRALGHR